MQIRLIATDLDGTLVPAGGSTPERVLLTLEEAMRREFERLLPTMRTGGYIPSVDHQTPPDVSLENYHTYVRLLREYTRKAAAAAG